LDRSSEAEAISVMLAPRNSEVATVTSYEDPQKFFQELFEKDPSLASRLSYLIDRAGGFRSVDSNAIVEAYMTLIHEAKNSVYVARSADGSQVAFQSGKEAPPTLLDGSNLIDAMKRNGLDPALLTACFFYYDIQATTGTDWPVPPSDSIGLLTIGEGETIDDGIQALLRNRGISREDQQFKWILSEKMVQVIQEKTGSQGGVPTPKEIVLWLIENGAAEQEKKIWMRFQQGIEAIFVDHIKKKENVWGPSRDNFAAYLEKTASSSPIDRYYIPQEVEKLEDKIEQLHEIVRSQYERLYPAAGSNAGYPEAPWLEKLSGQAREDMKLLISQTATLIKKISVGGSKLDAEEMREQEQEQNQEKLQQNELELQLTVNTHRSVSSKPEDYKHEEYSIGSAGFIAPCNTERTRLFGDNRHISLGYWLYENRLDQNLSPNKGELWSKNFPLILSDQFIIDSPNFERSTYKFGYLRPVRNFLVKIDSSKMPATSQFIPLSTTGFAHYMEQLHGKEVNGSPSYLLLSKEGTVVHRGTANAAEIAELEGSSALKEAVNIAALLELEVRDPEVIAGIVRKLELTQDEFRYFLQLIGNRQLGIVQVDKAGIAKVEELCGWKSPAADKLDQMAANIAKAAKKAVESQAAIPMRKARNDKTSFSTRVITSGDGGEENSKQGWRNWWSTKWEAIKTNFHNLFHKQKSNQDNSSGSDSSSVSNGASSQSLFSRIWSRLH
jgi:hypothetical protein